jgi:hypothetical protein
MDQTKINDAIKSLYEKYKDDPFMSAKTESFICQQLPILLQNIEKNHVEQVQRVTQMNAEQDVFIQGFLESNRYFYSSPTENFFYYDGTNYSNVTEDEILHNVLTSISRDRSLMTWKYKTKSAIMKRIKENAIFACIPESATIQSVLNSLYPTTFVTKAEAKYFLTVLGDNMLKKHSEGSGGSGGPLDPLIHILNSSSKTFINSLNALSQMWFGVNLNQTFKYKYHADHAYSQMRILHSTNNFTINGMNGLNLLCVACHYSNRYQSSDNYLLKYSNDDTIINTVLYLKNLSPESLIDMFVGEYIRVTPTSGKLSLGNNVINDFVFKPTQITWKNMYYLWSEQKCH